MEKQAIIETIKFILRTVIIWSPFLLTLVTDIGSTGLFVAFSTALMSADKLVHETKSIDRTGIIPF